MLTDKLLASGELGEGSARDAFGGAGDRGQGAVQPAQAQGRARQCSRRRNSCKQHRRLDPARPRDRDDQRARASSAGDRSLGPKAAQALLEQALGRSIRARAITITNLAVLAIDRGECDAAQRSGGQARVDLRGHDSVVRARLLARTYLCGKPDARKAADAFALAEKRGQEGERAQLAPSRRSTPSGHR